MVYEVSFFRLWENGQEKRKDWNEVKWVKSVSHFDREPLPNLKHDDIV